MLKRVFIYVLFISLSTTVLYSQQYFFRKYSVEEGLPQSSVFCLLQDSRNYIWMGTNGGGVTRFDGKKFETFTITDGLSDNIVRSLFEDSKGNIWIGTISGLTFYDGFNFKPIGEEAGLTGSAVLKITEGSNGTIWAGTNDKGLFGLTFGDSISVVNYSIQDGLLGALIFDIYEDREKKLWLAMGGGVNIIEFKKDSSAGIKNINTLDFDLDVDSTMILSIEPDIDGTILLGCRYGKGLFRAVLSPDKKTYIIKSSSINELIPGLTIWDILCRGDGEIWIATENNGVIRLKDDKVVGRFNKENGLSSNQIYKMMEDNEGNSWFASLGQGVMMFNDEKFLNYGPADGLIGNQVFNILFGSGNIFYAATEEGFLRFRKEGDKIRRLNSFSSGNGLNDIAANSIAIKDQEIWIGTNNGINIFDGSKLSEFMLNDKLPNLTVNCLLADREGALWIGTSGGFGRFSGGKLFFMSQDDSLIHNEVQTIIEDSKGRIWMGTIGGLVKLEGEKYTDFNEAEGLSFLRINCLAEDPAGNIWIGTFGGGIFKFDNNKTLPISNIATKQILSSNNINSLLFVNDSIAIVGTDKGFDLLHLNNQQSITKVISYGINDGFSGGENNPNSVAIDKSGLIWFGTGNGLVRFDPGIDENYHYSPATYITGIKLFFKEVDWKEKDFKTAKWSGLPENLVLSHKDNHVTFEFTGFSFNSPDDLMFSYFLEPQSKEWSPYSSDREFQFPALSPGNYSFKVKARNKYGISGNVAEFRFIIRPPFWQTKLFIISSSIFIIFVIIIVVRLRERNLRNEKIKLEKIVEERTREVVEQKDEIEKQRDVVTAQKKEITDSINYAETIQLAVLPEEKILKKTFSDYFIILRPKDIVSGDFYWMTEKNNHVVFTASDCTGHGVPGALMSMLGVSFLNKIVNESGIIKPSTILTSLRENVISALKQEESLKASKDGMDIALCSIDIKKMKLWFSGANNPLYVIRKEKNEYVIIEKKGDRMPIGYYSIMSKFTNHEVDIQKGDTIYLFSDGFIDQFGGPDGRKFMMPRFRQMLLDNQELDMSSQKETFINILDEWINCPSVQNKHSGQVDDIILLGLRI